jgi:flagellar assembly protein FliH
MRSSEDAAAAVAAGDAFAFEQLSPAPGSAAVRPPRPAAAARAEAETIVARARAEAQAIREEARARGRDEGYRAGLEEAQRKLEPAQASLAQTGRDLARLREEAIPALERDAAELALRVAEKVVAGTLTVEPERVVDVVRGALRAMVDRERVVVQVHPDDLDLVRESAAELAGALGGIERLEVQAERRVAPGGASVRTALGELDATIETKLARAREIVEAELRA